MKSINYFCNDKDMFVAYDKLVKKMIGASIPKPLSGTLSGHAAGEPFDKNVYEEIKKRYPGKTFRQYEYLNNLFAKNPGKTSANDRNKLFPSEPLGFLLARGKTATAKWSKDNLFEEKQNDTADILIADKGKYEIIDIKTRNLSKVSQPPNIISAYKLAQLCVKILDNKKPEIFTISYFGVDWRLSGNRLVCEDAHYANLFKSDPKKLYINWAAAMQIQFYVCDLDQEFKGDMKSWAKAFLKHFTIQAQKRSEDMMTRFVGPFVRYTR